MKIAILGMGGQGQAAYEYWSSGGNELTVCDADLGVRIPEGAESRLGPDYLNNLNKFDLLIRTPALHPSDIVKANSDQPNILSKVTTVTNEFFRVCPSKNIIGVTGTKGKGTTSTLISKILKEAGFRVHLGGNIGIPPLEMLKDDIQPEDWVILELANYQLIDIEYSPPIAVCLMVEPEHLDWHENVDEYIKAKQQLFIHQAKQDIAIYYSKSENSIKVAGATAGQLIPYMEQPGATVEGDTITIDGQEICKTSQLKLLGKHNWQNVCAAVTAAWQITQDIAAIRRAVTYFSGLEHRLEFVREVDGIKYYDDSFGTTPETAMVAVEAFAQPKVAILGGSDKGSKYDNLAATIDSNNVRSVVVIGQMGAKIADALRSKGFKDIVQGGNTMEQIVQTAREQAKPGDVILLSTACASFDLFNDYKDRGEQFKNTVLALS